MLAKTYSAAVVGVEALTVEVEVNATGEGEETRVNIVGLPDAAVRESRDRVRSALQSCGYLHPIGTTVIGLAPADVKKEGAAFDLPIALGMIATMNQIPREVLSEVMIIGELALDGSVRPVKGALPIALHAAKQSLKALIVPGANAAEAAVASGKLPVYGVDSLPDAVKLLTGNPDKNRPVHVDLESYFQDGGNGNAPDFADVKGQQSAKRAMEIAAAGGHNVLMVGVPGSGKSMIAKRLPGILPPMTLDEALETTKIHSIIGLLQPDTPVLKQRPFRAPHHTVSDAGLLGGQTVPTPGEISVAHNGVLFLDELPEFKRNVLEVMRQPLENREVTVSRAAGSFTFPAGFVLVAAMNPCPCGFHGSSQRECRCGPNQINRYRSRVSGPLLDRIDIHVEVSALSEDELMAAPNGENSTAIRERVIAARRRQQTRFEDLNLHCNAQMDSKQLQDHCQLDKEGRTHLRHSIRELNLSARAYDRILRVGRTIADLEGVDAIAPEHLYEAIQYRCLDRRLW